MTIIFLIIFTLFLGGLGGSLQVPRLLILAAPVLLGIRKFKDTVPVNKTIRFGLWVYFIWIFYGVISLFWSPDPLVGLSSEILVMSIGMISLLIFPLVIKNNEDGLKTIRNAWVYGLICTLPFAFYEISTMQHFMTGEGDRVLGGIGLYAPYAAVFFGNYNNYCVYICLCLPMIYWSLFETNKYYLKILYMLLLACCLYIIVINTNRTSLFVFLFYVVGNLRLNFRTLFYMVAGILFFVVGFSILPASTRELLSTLYNYRINVDYSTDSSGLIRRNVWSEGLRFLEESYFFGVGAGGYEYHMLKSPKYETISNPHNLFLEIAVQYGIFIFLLFCGWLVALVLKIHQNITMSPYVKRLFYLSIISIPIIGIINSDSLGYTYWWLYFSSIATVASINYQNSNIKS